MSKIKKKIIVIKLVLKYYIGENIFTTFKVQYDITNITR